MGGGMGRGREGGSGGMEWGRGEVKFEFIIKDAVLGFLFVGLFFLCFVLICFLLA